MRLAPGVTVVEVGVAAGGLVAIEWVWQLESGCASAKFCIKLRDHAGGILVLEVIGTPCIERLKDPNKDSRINASFITDCTLWLCMTRIIH